jgi:lipopolysaccharide biosynthesis regulator YciM
MNKASPRTTILQALIALVLAFSTTAALAQRSAEERRSQRGSSSAQKQEVKYPNATRQQPEAKPSAKMASKLQKLVGHYNKDEYDRIPPLAEEIIADPKANAYDKSMASRLLGASLIDSDANAAIEALRRALEFNGLNNNDHFETMWIMAQLQVQEEKNQDAIATIDRLMAETNARMPEFLGMKGAALYQQDRYQDMIPVLEEAMQAAGDKARPEWAQMLILAYSETGQEAKATALAEQLAARTPGDKRAQMNLAAAYIQAGQDARAIEVYERLRAAGELTEERDYKNLVALYMNSENGEQKAIEVINEGLGKQILKPDYQTYSILAQAYYFSDQGAQAVEAYRKAAPLAADGEGYLNLAKVLWSENRIGEAKQAAQQALDRGIKNPQEAQNILKLKE